MLTISDEFFIRVSVSPFWPRSPVLWLVPPTLKIPFVNRNHRICVKRSWGFLFCFGRCVFRTYTSAYWEDKRSTKRDINANLSKRKPMVLRVRYSKDHRFVLRLSCIIATFSWALLSKYALVLLREWHLRKNNENPTTSFVQIRWLRYSRSFLLECRFLLFDNGHQCFNRYHLP